MGNIKIEVDLDKYITEDEKRRIALQVFKDKIEEACSVIEGDRLMKNAISHWLSQELDKVMTDEHRRKLRDGAMRAIEEGNYGYEIFKKPDVWDRSEFTAHSLITQVVVDHREVIRDWATNKILKYIGK